MQVTVKTTHGQLLGDYEFSTVPATGDTITVPEGVDAGAPFTVVRRVFHGSTQRDAPIRPILIVLIEDVSL